MPAGKGENTRVELRSPDSAANPYLAFAVCLEAGLDGIKNQIMPPKGQDVNLFELSEKERVERGIDVLPETLSDALDELEKDAFVKAVLGEKFASRYIAEKRKEWEQFRRQVTNWELESYLYKF